MSGTSRFLRLILNLTEGRSNDVLGAYPAKVHVPAMPERRYLHTARIMTIASVISMCATMILSSILYLLPPQVNTIPRFMVLNKYDSDIEPIGRFTARVEAMDFIMEKLVADYVRMRNTIVPDIDVMTRSLRPGNLLDVMSSAAVSAANRAEQQRFLSDVKKYEMSREIKILWVKKLSNVTWRVRYETVDTYNDRDEPKVQSWYATVRALSNIQGQTKEEQMKNPFGFRVTGYATTKAPDVPEDAERFVFEE